MHHVAELLFLRFNQQLVQTRQQLLKGVIGMGWSSDV
jgi:hypothetical protein